MPNTHSTLTALFSDIADSIRSKAGTSAPIVADAFPAAIDAIPTGGGGGDITWDNIAMRTLSGTATGSATTIGIYAFYNCSSLTTASFPVCRSIGDYAFSGCRNLTTTSFPVCETIGNHAFYSCTKLTTASFSVCTIVSDYAFYSCRSLTTASFPVCRSIGSSAFADCRMLLSLYLLGSSVPILSNTNAFMSTPISSYTTSTGGINGSIIVQASMLDAFKAATNWSIYSSRFSVWNGID